MGAKAPSKLKLRRATYKCDECPKKYLSTQALRTHQTHHKIKGYKKPIKGKGKLTALLGKAVKKEEVKIVKNSVERKLPVRKKSLPLGDVDEALPVSDVRRIEFECPQCSKIFGVYFSAFRHIQKMHCINSLGMKVPPNSPDLIKPLRLERCVKCDMRIRNNDVHFCSELINTSLIITSYVCTGCNQKFSSSQLFELHVAGLHCDNNDSLFFTTTSDFFTWKDHMESITNVKYLIMSKCNSKQSYRCTYFPTKEEDEFVAHFCPSSIIVREYSKGIQVHFYKHHYGHSCPEYTIPEKFQKNCITTLMQQTIKTDSDLFDNTDEKDLYVQFKTLMDSIVLEAAKLNISTLKILVGKALEMTPVLNSYDEEESENIPKNSNKNMSDDQITKALETFNNTRTQNEVPRLRVKTIPEVNKIDTPKILNTFSLVDEVKKEIEEFPTEIIEQTPAKQMKRVKIQENLAIINNAKKDIKDTPNESVSSASLSCFNDSYKDFVDKNFKIQQKIDRMRKSGEVKISQTHISKIEDKIRKTSYFDQSYVNTIDDHMLKPDDGKFGQTHVTIINDKVRKSSGGKICRTQASTIDQNKKGIDVPKKIALRKLNKINIKKQIVKTKIGQFKPSISPKKIDIAEKRESISSIGSGIKKEICYEVKEQENDCNILILKF